MTFIIVAVALLKLPKDFSALTRAQMLFFCDLSILQVEHLYRVTKVTQGRICVNALASGPQGTS